MGIDYENLGDEILLPGAHPGPPLSAAALRAVSRQRHPLHIAAVTDGDHHVLGLDQVLVILFVFGFLDGGAAVIAKGGADFHQFVTENLQQQFAGTQNIEIIGDLVHNFFQFFGDFIPLQPSQAVQTQVENGLGLGFGEPVITFLVHGAAGFVNKRDQGANFLGRPATFQHLFLGHSRILGGADEFDHGIEVGHR